MIVVRRTDSSTRREERTQRITKGTEMRQEARKKIL